MPLYLNSVTYDTPKTDHGSLSEGMPLGPQFWVESIIPKTGNRHQSPKSLDALSSFSILRILRAFFQSCSVCAQSKYFTREQAKIQNKVLTPDGT